MKKQLLVFVLLLLTMSLFAAPRQYVLFEVVTGTW